MKKQIRNRGYLISAEKRLFKQPIIKITDGKQTVIFNGCGTFVIETDKDFSVPLIIPD